MKACDITWYLMYSCKDDSHGINQSKNVVSKDLEVKINDKLKFFCGGIEYDGVVKGFGKDGKIIFVFCAEQSLYESAAFVRIHVVRKLNFNDFTKMSGKFRDGP